MTKQEKIDFIKKSMQGKTDTRGYVQVNKSPIVGKFFIDGVQIRSKGKLRIWISDKNSFTISYRDEERKSYEPFLNALYDYMATEKGNAFSTAVSFHI